MISRPAQVIPEREEDARPSGLMVDLDWKAQPTPFGPPLEKRFSIAKARQLIESAGFHVASAAEVGRNHYIIIAGR